YDRSATFGARRIHPPEWPKQIGSRLGLSVVAVVEKTDQSGETKRTRHEHGFVVLFVGFLPEPNDILNRPLELFFRKVHVPRKRMQVLNERDKNFPQPRRLRVFESLRHRFGDVFLPLNNHEYFPFIAADSWKNSYIFRAVSALIPGTWARSGKLARSIAFTVPKCRSKARFRVGPMPGISWSPASRMSFLRRAR